MLYQSDVTEWHRNVSYSTDLLQCVRIGCNKHDRAQSITCSRPDICTNTDCGHHSCYTGGCYNILFSLDISAVERCNKACVFPCVVRFLIRRYLGNPFSKCVNYFVLCQSANIPNWTCNAWPLAHHLLNNLSTAMTVRSLGSARRRRRLGLARRAWSCVVRWIAGRWWNGRGRRARLAAFGVGSPSGIRRPREIHLGRKHLHGFHSRRAGRRFLCVHWLRRFAAANAWRHSVRSRHVRRTITIAFRRRREYTRVGLWTDKKEIAIHTSN